MASVSGRDSAVATILHVNVKVERAVALTALDCRPQVTFARTAHLAPPAPCRTAIPSGGRIARQLPLGRPRRDEPRRAARLADVRDIDHRPARHPPRSPHEPLRAP